MKTHRLLTTPSLLIAALALAAFTTFAAPSTARANAVPPDDTYPKSNEYVVGTYTPVSGPVKLDYAIVTFNTLDDDKDKDTAVWIDVYSRTNQRIAWRESIARSNNSSTCWKDWSEKRIKLYVPRENTVKPADCNSLDFKIRIEPKGNDTWRFGVKLYLQFTDGTMIFKESPSRIELKESNGRREISVGGAVKVQAPPAATTVPMLQRAEMLFNTKNDDKDHDTGVYVDVTANGKTIAQAIHAANKTTYKDNSNNTLALNLVGSTKKSDCTNLKVMLASAPVGNDNWYFDGKMTLFFTDGTQVSVTAANRRQLDGRNSKKTAWLDLAGPPIGQSSSSSTTQTTPKTGTTRVGFAKGGGPQDKIKGMDVWNSMGIGPGVPNTAVAVSVKNTSKYAFYLGEQGADPSVNPTRYFVKNQVRLAAGQSTAAFAGRNWTVVWVINGPIQDNPPDGRPQIEVTWKTP